VNSHAITVIKLSGELEIGRRAEIRSALKCSPHGGGTAVLIDFSEVTYADSTAVAELLRFHNEAAAARVPVAVVIGNRRFARLLEYAGMADAFAVFDARASALTYLGQQT
jgi:anti-anti-sigma factor